MSDYMVGRKASGSKDKYMVGWNESKSNANAYKVGGGGSSVGQSDNKKLGSGGLDPVVGSKSAFGYEGELDPKDIGDRNENSNLGGGESTGMPANKQRGGGGEIEMAYTEKGDFQERTKAMNRRLAGTSFSGDGYDSPTVTLVTAKSK